MTVARDLTTTIFETVYPPEQLAQKQDFDCFVACMNEKAAQLGMTKSCFRDAAGLNNMTTAKDLLRLMVYAYKTPNLQRFWSQDSHTVTVMGEHPRTVECVSKSLHPDLIQHYRVLGRKGGALRSSRLGMYINNMAAILEIPGSRDRLAVVVMYAPEDNEFPNNKFKAARELADIAIARYQNPEADITAMPLCCENAVAAVLLADGGDYEILYEKDADAQGRPMSISKVLTALCVLEQVKDLTETITYDAFDANIGGFYVSDFLPGDKVTYEDAIYAMLLESSNVTAQALARSVGQKFRK